MEVRSRFAVVLVGALWLSFFVATAVAQPRETVSLDGEWDFATDLDNQGEIDGWYAPGAQWPAMPLPGYAPEANGKIQVPGIWDNQGYGTATDKVHHNFVGKGWYRRCIEIPATWAGRRVFITVGGVQRYSKIWIDGRFVGEHIGCVSSQEWDITPLITPGAQSTITIQVDSKQRWEIDSLFGTSTLADYMFIAWGGIWGHVQLEARGEAWVSDLFVQPIIAEPGCLASATINGNAALADNARLEVIDAKGATVADVTLPLAAGAPLAVKASMPGATLWAPDTPVLYTARLSLMKGGAIVDAVETRFGLREFSVDGHHLLLNGKRIMLRGYGDDHVYAQQMAMPSDKALHIERLRLAKSYGFNFVRNHSAMMPPEYYEACDEVGVIATAEFPICYHIYLPGVGYMWLANALPGTDPAACLETYRREWRASILRHRNHPSICAWVRGNELYEPHPQREEFQAIARELDPARLYIDSDSISPSVLDPANDRPTLDFYTVPFNEGTNPLDNPQKFAMNEPKKPVISHESGNYVTFSRPSLVDEFQHNFKPFWLTVGKATLAKLGLLAEADQWAEKSERLFTLCHKANTEAMRASPFICGYQWWNLQDYWMTSNGIVDHYFRPKAIAPEEIRAFNNDVVLLGRPQETTYRGKGTFAADISVSNFSPGEIQGELTSSVTVAGQSIMAQNVPLPPVAQGTIAEITKLHVDLPDVPAPEKLVLTATLAVGDARYANAWQMWLYPSEIKPAALPVPAFAEASLGDRINATWQIPPVPADGALSERAVYVVASLGDPRVVDALDRGACVVVLGELAPAIQSCAITFRPSWWHGTTNAQVNHAGTFVYEHPTTRAMAPDNWCDMGWLNLMEGARKFYLDAAPALPHLIIRALPTLEKIEQTAVLFEVGVGQGCLIASGLNHQRAAGRPENDWIIARLIEYAATLPHPSAAWPAAFLRAPASPASTATQ